MRFLAPILFSALAALSTLAAQAPPSGEHRPWIELGLGGSRQDPNCGGCYQRTSMGGPTATLSIGATVTPRFGVALLLREFSEFDFENSHSAQYVVGLAQYTPIPGFTFNAGLGTHSQNGDDPPYGDNGSGSVIAGGVALRLPAQTTFAFTLNVDWMKSLSGRVRTQFGQPGSSYRPLLFTIGIGLNIAASNESPR